MAVFWGCLAYKSKKSRKKITLSHNSVNSYCYFAHMDFHDQISQKTKKSISVFFFVVSSFHSQNQAFRCLLRNEWQCSGGVWHTNQKSHEKKLLSHINLLTHIAISRTWTFTTTHQIFSRYLKKQKSRFHGGFQRDHLGVRFSSTNIKVHSFSKFRLTNHGRRRQKPA